MRRPRIGRVKQVRKPPIAAIYRAVLVERKSITAEANPDGESYVLSVGPGPVFRSYVASSRGFTRKIPKRGYGSTEGCMGGLRPSIGRRDPFLKVIGSRK